MLKNIGKTFDNRGKMLEVYECEICKRRYRESSLKDLQTCPNCNHELYMAWVAEELEIESIMEMKNYG